MLELPDELASTMSSGLFSTCSILTAEQTFQDEVLDKLSTLEEKLSISRKISL